VRRIVKPTARRIRIEAEYSASRARARCGIDVTPPRQPLSSARVPVDRQVVRRVAQRFGIRCLRRADRCTRRLRRLAASALPVDVITSMSRLSYVGVRPTCISPDRFSHGRSGTVDAAWVEGCVRSGSRPAA